MTKIEEIIVGESERRNALKEIFKKVCLGIILNILILISYLILNSETFSFETFGLGFFLIGGIFLVVGGIRDIMGSIMWHKISARENKAYLKNIDSGYLYGFGKTGEDVLSGFVLIIISIVTMSI